MGWALFCSDAVILDLARIVLGRHFLGVGLERSCMDVGVGQTGYCLS